MAHGRGYFLEDKDWKVEFINSYAVLMGYLSIAFRGLGLLMLTWTTVVLLGGFVSMLHKKDFWCLTFITLVQMVGLYGDLNERLSYVVNAGRVFLVGAFLGMLGTDWDGQICSVRFLLAVVLTLVQAVTLLVLLCPVAIMYTFGVLISGGISLWRLIEHDYSDSDGEASNLPPAMDTLYYLALLQAVLFCYRLVVGIAGRSFASGTLLRGNGLEKQVVSDYMRETRIGCQMDPSSAKGRNLVTHAVDMIGSNSPVDCVSGVRMLYTAICSVETELHKLVKRSTEYREQQNIVTGQCMLMKHLIVSASSSTHILNKLIEALDSRGLHERETRNQAAMILERLACSINLEKFPRGIQHISSLIGTFQEYSIAGPYEQDCVYNEQCCVLTDRSLTPSAAGIHGNDYKELVLLGLCIFRKLATDKINCKVMSDTPDLICKIMAPIASDLLHHTIDDHGEWSYIVQKSVEVMSQLTGAPGETGAKLRHDISRCEEAISTLWRILSCNKCNEKLQQRAIQILTRLYMDTTEGSKAADSVLNKESKEDFVRMLVDIFTSDEKYSNSIRGCAGGALSEICSYGGISNATIVIQTRVDIIDGLTKILQRDKIKICRQAAAEILSNIHTHCTDSSPSSDVLPSSPAPVPSVCTLTTPTTQPISPSPHPNVKDLGELMKAIFKVVGEILDYGDGTHEGKEVDQERFPTPKTDIESQFDNGQGNRISSSSSSHSQKDEQGEGGNESVTAATLLSSLLSLFGTVYDMTSIDDLPPHLDTSSFLNKLEEVVVKKNDHHKVENLLLFKAIAKMVIVMMKHSGDRSIKQEDIRSMLDALSGAWRKILDLDYSMIFSSFDSNSATTSSKLNRCTLASLLKEAQELHAKMPSTSVSG